MIGIYNLYKGFSIKYEQVAANMAANFTLHRQIVDIYSLCVYSKYN